MAESKHPHDHQQCLKMFAQLSDFIDGELDAVVCKEIEAHARKCDRCHVCLETLKRTVDICGHTKPLPVPKHLSAKLRNILVETGNLHSFEKSNNDAY